MFQPTKPPVINIIHLNVCSSHLLFIETGIFEENTLAEIGEKYLQNAKIVKK